MVSVNKNFDFYSITLYLYGIIFLPIKLFQHLRYQGVKMEIVITNIKNLLDERKMTQSELAEKIGTTQTNISRYLSGTRKIDLDILEKIATVFSVSLDYLLGRDDKDAKLKIALNSISTEGLNDDDIEMVKGLIENLKKKNQK